MHQIPERLRELTDRLLGRDDYDDDDDEYDEDEDDEEERARGAAAVGRKSLSEDLLATGPIDLGALDAAVDATLTTEPEHTELRALPRRRSSTGPRRRRTCRRSTSRSSCPSSRSRATTCCPR